VAIGTAANTYTLPGLASAASLAAQVGPTNFITTDANGNLAASPFGTGSFASAGSVRPSPPPPRACRRGLALFSNTQSTGRREARQGIAGAMAIATAPLPSAPGRLTYIANGATFPGEFAAGGSIAY
jgi:trimeric autotransporter adhesin